MLSASRRHLFDIYVIALHEHFVYGLGHEVTTSALHVIQQYPCNISPLN